MYHQHESHKKISKRHSQVLHALHSEKHLSVIIIKNSRSVKVLNFHVMGSACSGLVMKLASCMLAPDRRLHH